MNDVGMALCRPNTFLTTLPRDTPLPLVEPYAFRMRRELAPHAPTIGHSKYWKEIIVCARPPRGQMR